MSDDSTRPIVIKRKKVVAGGAHGGAWKIAYADFVTAMMAFFLLMWLLSNLKMLAILLQEVRFLTTILFLSQVGL